MRWACYVHAMNRTRVSTTVDPGLLSAARLLTDWRNDASMFDAALEALVQRHRRSEVDAAYAAYDTRPLDETDEWGDLEAFRTAIGQA